MLLHHLAVEVVLHLPDDTLLLDNLDILPKPVLLRHILPLHLPCLLQLLPLEFLQLIQVLHLQFQVQLTIDLQRDEMLIGLILWNQIQHESILASKNLTLDGYLLNEFL